jgi:Holliday junction resolvasome RuvABC endonuclease subunit
MKYYMGLDLSLTGAGVVVLDEAGAVVRQAVFGYELDRKATPRDKIERILFIASRVIGLVGEVNGTGEIEWEAGVEHYAFRQHGAVADLGEINGVVKTQLWLAHGIVPRVVVVSSARKLVTGKGNIKKDQIIPLLRTRGLVFEDHNIADAYVIAEALRRRCDDDGSSERKPRARRARKGSTGRGGRVRSRRDPQTSFGFT